MKLYILSRLAGSHFVKDHPETPIIIIKETTTSLNKVEKLTRAIDHLVLSFDDIEVPYGIYLPASIEDITEGLKWAENKEEIAIACAAGISRSSAMAYIIACSRMNPDEALKYLNKEIHSPNQWMVKLGSQILNNPEILLIFLDWSYTQINSEFNM